ncbi:hypothetical protein SOVF_093060 [Spinacia oleracea]|nr:hypothetical protein SOVF_093060 [Spinacia oleracea]
MNFNGGDGSSVEGSSSRNAAGVEEKSPPLFYHEAATNCATPILL